jgi:hypothetical protein
METIPKFSRKINIHVEFCRRIRNPSGIKRRGTGFPAEVPPLAFPGAALILPGDPKRRKWVSGTSAHTGTGYHSIREPPENS